MKLDSWAAVSSLMEVIFYFFYNTVGIIAEELPAICYYQTEMAWGIQREADKVTEVYSESDTAFVIFASIKHYNDSKLIRLVVTDKTSVDSSCYISTQTAVEGSCK